ncbi:MAG: FAD-dependent thymidylate synthase [Patescibacteria group bacterium]|nr:FAD-dependent thymidylate synthase [Patescibacteria group bacterium]
MQNYNQRQIYLLKDLTPEVKAVTFAKCSRSPKSFKEIATELTEEKSAEFHEKWVVGYGHSSVAEHAVLSIAFENVSILASKFIEDNRLASYTEKSTRYQDFSAHPELLGQKNILTPYRYYCPPEIINSEFKDEYIQVLDNLFKTYENLLAPMTEFIKNKYPREDGIIEGVYNSIAKARVFDNIRYLLPVATLTNLGMTVNARNLEHAICKMKSQTLTEIKDIGEELKQAAQLEVPTLIKYADQNDYLQKTQDQLLKISQSNLKPQDIDQQPVALVNYDPQAEIKLAIALLYKNANLSYRQIEQQVKNMSDQDKQLIIDQALNQITEHDWPIRELEHIAYTFDILIDYGAFRDIQRHRMCTQTNQILTADYGYDIPEEIQEANLQDQYISAMEKAQDLNLKLQEKYRLEAQYILPLAFRKRTLYTWNLRELHWFIKLRSGGAGHASYRKIAQLCFKEIEKVHPFLAKYIRVNLEGIGAHT